MLLAVHKARDKRLVSDAVALAKQPGKPLPELVSGKFDIEATIRLN
jgi:hypothetical protein